MTDTDTLAHIEAVLAAATEGPWIEREEWKADKLRAATYPEALAVVRAVTSQHAKWHVGDVADCTFVVCQSAAAYLAKAQDATEAPTDD